MLKRIGTASLIVCLCFSTATSQSAPSSSPTTTPQQPAATNEPAAPKPAMQGFGLEDGTPVKLRTSRTISSADAHTGDTLDFEVLEDVFAKDTLVVPKGGIAWGTVTEAQPKRRMARGGKLNVNIDSVRLADGEKAALRAVKEVRGGGHTGAMTGAMVATGIVFFPAAPLFLFMHGKDITIPKGTEITAYVNGNIPLDPIKFQTQTATKPVADSTPAQPSPVAATATSANGGDPVLSLVEVKSTPDGADITVDDKYMGSTPSTLKLAAGDHKIKLEKSGFKR